MGLSHFPTASDGVLLLLVMNTIVYDSLLKNMVKSVLHLVGSVTDDSVNFEDDPDENMARRRRRILITQFKSLCQNRDEETGCSDRSGGRHNCDMKETSGCALECCVCLYGFEAEEEVSELSCKHFFHRSCLDKWFGNKHGTCPLCRSMF